MSAYVLTSRAHGSPARFPSGSPRSSYSPNHSHAHCPLCCYVFTVCLKNFALSNSLLYIKSELSFVVPSKTSATNTHTAHFTADPTSRYLAKISLCMWLTWEASQSGSQTLSFFFLFFLREPTPRHSPPLLLWWGPLGDEVLQSLLHVLSSQLPCLHFVILDGCVNLELSTARAVQRQTSCKA